MNTKFLTLIFLICMSTLSAQKVNLSGKVSDINNKPLKGINITVKESSKYGTSTNSSGQFSMSMLKGQYTIIVSSVNFQNIEKVIKLEKNTMLNFILKEKETKLDEVIITATGLTKSTKNIAGSVSVVNQQTIQEMGAQNIGEVIQNAPGVNFLDEDGRGLKPNIGLRGMNPNRNRSVLVLEDGKFPVGMTLYGDPAAYYFTPVQHIDRIEIIRGGAASVLYGGNSIGGVVNLISKKAPHKQQTNLSLTYGSYNNMVAQISTGKNNGKTSYFVNGVRRQGNSFRENGRFEVNDLSAKIAVRPDDSSELSVFINGFNEVSHTPGGLNQEQFNKDIKQSNNYNDIFYSKRFSTSIEYSKSINEFSSFNISVYGNYFERDWYIATTSNKRKGFVRDIHNIGIVSEFQSTKNLGSLKNTFIGGIRIHGDRLNANTVEQAEGDFSSKKGILKGANVSTGFSHEYYLYDELHLNNNFVLTPGVRFSSIKYNKKDLFKATEQSSNTIISLISTLGLVYNVNTNTSLYLNLSKGFQPPGLRYAVDSDTIEAGVDLKSESSFNYEFGFKSNLTDWLTLNTTAYLIDFKDKISKVEGVFKNIGHTRHKGIEAEIEMGAWNGFSLFTNATFQKSTFVNDDKLKGNSVPYSPETMIATGLRHKANLGGGYLVTNLSGNFIGKQYHDDKNTEKPSANGANGAIPAYNVINGSIGYSTKTWGVSLAVRNLLNEKYFTKRQAFFGGILPSSPTDVRLNVSYKF